MSSGTRSTLLTTASRAALAVLTATPRALGVSLPGAQAQTLVFDQDRDTPIDLDGGEFANQYDPNNAEAVIEAGVKINVIDQGNAIQADTRYWNLVVKGEVYARPITRFDADGNEYAGIRLDAGGYVKIEEGGVVDVLLIEVLYGVINVKRGDGISVVEGNVTNEGLIRAGDNGVALYNGGRVINLGTIETGPNGTGIETQDEIASYTYVFNAENAVIQETSTGLGLYSNGSGTASAINSGYIQADLGIATGEISATIINTSTGFIESSFDGMSLFRPNDSVIRNDGEIHATKAGIAIYFLSVDETVSISNAGALIGGDYGIYASYPGYDLGAIALVNSGTVRGGDAVIGFGVGNDNLTLDTGSNLQGGPVLDANNNPTGLYEAGVVLGGDGTDSLTLRGTGAEDAEFQDFETLKVESGADWRLSGEGTFANSIDVLGKIGLDGTVLAGSVTVRDGGALGGAGTLDSSGVTFEEGSRLAQRIVNGTADVLDVATGTVTIQSGSSVELTLDGAVADGTTFTLLTGDIAGAFEDFFAITVRSGFAIETGTSEVTATFDLRTFAEAGESENQQAVGAALDAAEANCGAEFEELVAAVDTAGGDLGVAALDQVSGDFHASTASTGLVTARGFIEGLAGRVGAGSNGGQVAGLGQVASLTQVAAGPLPSGPGAGFGAWAALDGTFGTLEDENAGDTDYDAFGGTVGGDFAVMPNLFLGAAVGFAVGSSETADRGATADSTVIRLAGYGRWFSGPISVTGALGASFGSLESERATPLGLATGETDATAFGFAAEGRYALALGGFTVSPLAGVSFTTLTQDAFEESGAGAANLSVGEATADSLRASLGAVASKAIRSGGATITPEARLLYRHEFADGFGEVSNAFLADATATSFTVIGAEPAADVVEVGAGVTAELANGMSLFGDLGFTLGDGQTETNVAAGLRMSF